MLPGACDLPLPQGQARPKPQLHGAPALLLLSMLPADSPAQRAGIDFASVLT